MEGKFKNKFRAVKKFKDIDFDNMDIYKLSRIDVNNMSTRQLRSFISHAVNIANEAFTTDNEQLKKSLNIISKQTGMRLYGGAKQIVKGYGNMTKSELQQRARLLQGHLGIDVFTSRAQRDYKDLNKETMDKISKRLGIEIEEDEYSTLWNLIHEVTNLYKSFDSSDVASLYEDARDAGKSGDDVLITIMDFMSKHGGMDHDDAIEMIGDALRKIY